MRIGILTLPFNNNYGGYLQAYALMQVLKREGHAVTLIKRMHNRRPFYTRLRYFMKSIYLRLIGDFSRPLIMNQESQYANKGKLQMHFVNKRIIPQTRSFYNTKELKKGTKDTFDIVIVGSDQVWRPEYGPNISNYFLDFIEPDIKKIAYGASFGTSQPYYTTKEISICSSLIENFDYISIRESDGINIIKNWLPKLEQQIEVVLDPTLLLTKEHYEGLISKDNINCTNKVLCYILDYSENAINLINEICHQTNLKEFHIIDEKKWKDNNYIMPSIEDWLSSINTSEFVITDSFHGTVFCILFNKPFFVYLNENRGSSRFLELLNKFNLSNRIVQNKKEVLDALNDTIDWNHVNLQINNLRVKSFKFLISAIKE